MISSKKGFILILLLLITFGLISCVDQTTTETTQSTGEDTSMTTTTSSQDLFDSIEIINETVVTGEKLEMAVYELQNEQTIKDLYNPYDYSEIRIEFVFTTPSLTEVKQLAFWYKEYKELALIGGQMDENGFYTAGQELVKWTDTEQSEYRVRITPDEAGTWQYQMNAYVEGEKIQTLSGSFEVVNSSEMYEGFIRVDEVTNTSFVFDDGQMYIPNGLNLAWWSTTLASHDYDNWFHELSLNQGNYARIWLSNWSFSLHKDSYSNFETRQSVAIRLDHVFDVADEYNIYIMLTLINHGQFSANTNPEWSENVYNEANGGMLEYPIQFFYNEEARAAYKNELLYIISRWGYSNHIFAWELFNEVDWIDGYSSIAVTRWHNEMATFLHENDPYNHLVTTSYKYTYGTTAYTLDSIDFCAFHSYAYGDTPFYSKLVNEVISLQNQYDKPVFFGEIGINWESGDSTYHSDYTGVTIHQANWGGLMLGTAGAMHWWWDSWIDKYDLWNLFLAPGIYSKQMDLAGKNYLQLAGLSSVSISSSNVGIMGYLLDDAIYGYLYNTSYSYWNRTPEEQSDVTVTIPMNNGTYNLVVYDTFTGEVLQTETITISNQQFILSGLLIELDMAFTLKIIND